MNKRLLLKAFLLFVISGLFAAFSFLWLNSHQPTSQLGQLVFANAINYEKSVDKITISTTKETFDLVFDQQLLAASTGQRATMPA